MTRPEKQVFRDPSRGLGGNEDGVFWSTMGREGIDPVVETMTIGHVRLCDHH